MNRKNLPIWFSLAVISLFLFSMAGSGITHNYTTNSSKKGTVVYSGDSLLTAEVNNAVSSPSLNHSEIVVGSSFFQGLTQHGLEHKLGNRLNRTNQDTSFTLIVYGAFSHRSELFKAWNASITSEMGHVPFALIRAPTSSNKSDLNPSTVLMDSAAVALSYHPYSVIYASHLKVTQIPQFYQYVSHSMQDYRIKAGISPASTGSNVAPMSVSTSNMAFIGTEGWYQDSNSGGYMSAFYNFYEKSITTSNGTYYFFVIDEKLQSEGQGTLHARYMNIETNFLSHKYSAQKFYKASPDSSGSHAFGTSTGTNTVKVGASFAGVSFYVSDSWTYTTSSLTLDWNYAGNPGAGTVYQNYTYSSNTKVGTAYVTKSLVMGELDPAVSGANLPMIVTLTDKGTLKGNWGLSSDTLSNTTSLALYSSGVGPNAVATPS